MPGDIEDRLDRLESLVDEQRERIERQHERIEDQQERIDAQRETIDRQREWIGELARGGSGEPGDTDGSSDAVDHGDSAGSDGSVGSTDAGREVPVTRRSALKAGGLLGLLGLGASATAGPAAADPQGQVGTADDPLRALYTESLRGGVTDGTDVRSLVGENLSIGDGGSLAATDTHVGVSNGGRTVVGDAADLNLGSGIYASDDGDGSVTVNVSVDDTTIPDTDTHTDVSDDGSTVVSSVEDIDFGANLSATETDDDTATVDADVTGATRWVDAGNSLLGTESGYTGIDVADVRVKNLRDRNGNSHLTLNGGGELDLNRTVDLTNNTLRRVDTVSGSDSGTGDLTIESLNDMVLQPNSNGDGTGCCVRIENNNGDEIFEALENGELKVPRLDSGGGVGRPLAVESADGELVRDVNIDLDGNDLEDDGTTVWDSSNSRIGTGKVTSESIATDAVGTDELATDFSTLAALFGDTPKVGGSGDLTANGILAASDTNDGKLYLQADDQIIFASEGLSDTNVSFKFGTKINSQLTPSSNNLHELGSSDKRWRNIYLNNQPKVDSDARLKQNITDVTDGLDRLADIRPVSYERKDEDDSETQLGFIAQELENAVPEAVTYPDDEDGYLGVTYNTVLPVAVDAIQTQQDRIDDLQAENDRLRDRVADLEARLDRIEAHLGVDASGERGTADD